MKLKELRKLIREEINKTRQGGVPRPVVYALSTSDGHFDGLVLYNEKDIVYDDEEDDEDGVFIGNHYTEGKFYFIDKLEI